MPHLNYCLQITPEIERRRLKIMQRRLGLSFQAKPKDDPKYEASFNGLSEGVTELCAGSLRRLITTRFGENMNLTEEQKIELVSGSDYKTWITLIKAIIQVVARAEGLSRESLRDELFIDHFSGTYQFLKRLERHRRGAVKLLRPLDFSPSEALYAAKMLDLVKKTKE